MTASKKYIACYHAYLCSQNYELMNYATSTLCNNNKEIKHVIVSLQSGFCSYLQNDPVQLYYIVY